MGASATGGTDSSRQISRLATFRFHVTSLATHDFATGELQPALEFLKRTRWGSRVADGSRLGGSFYIIDVNKDFFEIRGVGYPNADIVPLLRAVNTAFGPATIHDPTDAGTRNSSQARAHRAEDRVM